MSAPLFRAAWTAGDCLADVGDRGFGQPGVRGVAGEHPPGGCPGGPVRLVIGPRRTGGEIFSNVNAGIVYPLVVELRHPWISPLSSLDQLPVTAICSSLSNAGAAIQA